MKEVVTSKERAKIFETAWRVYWSTQSSDYAYRRAGAVGDKLYIQPIRTDEIERAAIEKVRDLQRAYAKSLLDETKQRVDEYVAMFPATSNPYVDGALAR